MNSLNSSPERTEEVIKNNYTKFVSELTEFLRVNPKELPEVYKDKYECILEELRFSIKINYDKEIKVTIYYKQELAMWVGKNKDKLQSLFEDLLSLWDDPDLYCYNSMIEIIKKGREIEATKKLNYKLKFK